MDRRTAIVILSFLALALVTSGCASAGQGEGGSSGSRNVIDREALFDMEGMNAYEAIQRLRPTWLRARRTGMGSPQLPGLVVNDQQSELYNLRTMRIEGIEEIRYVEARDASIRYGTGFPAGVIVVVQRQ